MKAFDWSGGSPIMIVGVVSLFDECVNVNYMTV